MTDEAAGAEFDEGMTGEKTASILSAFYEKALNGVPKVSRSIDEFADDYIDRFDTPERATKELVRYQIIKCGTSGFITGLGGLITLPVAIPANIGSVLYVQMRMVSAIAKIGGTTSAPTRCRRSSASVSPAPRSRTW